MFVEEGDGVMEVEDLEDLGVDGGVSLLLFALGRGEVVGRLVQYGGLGR